MKSLPHPAFDGGGLKTQAGRHGVGDACTELEAIASGAVNWTSN